MSTASVALRAAIHDALAADGALTAPLAGPKIYDSRRPRQLALCHARRGACHRLFDRDLARRGASAHAARLVVAGRPSRGAPNCRRAACRRSTMRRSRSTTTRWSTCASRSPTSAARPTGAPITRWCGFAPSPSRLNRRNTSWLPRKAKTCSSEFATARVTSRAGQRSRRIAFNAETVDITHAESAGRWRELLEGAGVKRASIAGRGLFKDEATDALVRQAFFDGAVKNCQIVIRTSVRSPARSRLRAWSLPASTTAR